MPDAMLTHAKTLYFGMPDAGYLKVEKRRLFVSRLFSLMSDAASLKFERALRIKNCSVSGIATSAVEINKAGIRIKSSLN